MRRYLLAMGCVLLTLFSGGVFAHTSIEGKYRTLSHPQPHFHDGQHSVEVLEFFSYACPHCYESEGLAEKLMQEYKGHPKVVIERVHVGSNPVFFPLQKLYYTVQTLKLDLHKAIFEAMIYRHKNLSKPNVLKDFVKEQGLDELAFDAVFNSFGVDVLARRSSQATVDYQVDATPIWIVNGKYRVDGETAGSNEEAVQVVRALIQRELGQ